MKTSKFRFCLSGLLTAVELVIGGGLLASVGIYHLRNWVFTLVPVFGGRKTGVIEAVICLVLGSLLLVHGIGRVSMLLRYMRYVNILRSRPESTLSDMATLTGEGVADITRRLVWMINTGLFPGARIDTHLSRLTWSAEEPEAKPAAVTAPEASREPSKVVPAHAPVVGAAEVLDVQEGDPMRLRLFRIDPECVGVEWISPERDANGDPVQVRKPQQHAKRVSRDGFTAAGRHYQSVRELKAKIINAPQRLYQDAYGRTVIDVRERYACFDAHDFQTENRYLHWYLVLQADRMSSVYFDDGTGEVIVVDDPALLPWRVWYILREIYHLLDGENVLAV